jgi:acetyl-CoA carboxylase carboxyl transferase subunit alpha
MRVLEFEKPVCEIEEKIKELKLLLAEHPEMKEELERLEGKADQIRDKVYSNLEPYQKIQLARHPDRPHTVDYIKLIMEDFVELHGDRLYSDDPAIVAGVGKIDGRGFALIGEEKGRTTKDKLKRNFGSPHPEGYRKGMKVMRLAERFGLPLITFVDTPGAYPGIGSEERGVALAIAESIRDMLDLRVPQISVIIGEGGSGGALAVASGDRVLALQFSFYSVISPEACASIIWRDPSKAAQAAESLKPFPEELLKLKIIDRIVPEPRGGAHRDWEATAASLKREILSSMKELEALDPDELIRLRWERYRAIGFFEEPAV